jgi:hypothetical protein
MTPDVQSAITQAATEAGVDPAFALAVAERESSGDPNARASKSIYGLFQMSGDLRKQYGSGNSADPYTQAKAWTGFITDTKQQLTRDLGRDPTNQELYLAHYFGEPRAAHLIGGRFGPDTNVRDVFTPQEMAENPNFARAGTTGNLMAGISGDITKRAMRFAGGQGATAEPPDFATLGTTPQTLTYKSTTDQPTGLSGLSALSALSAPPALPPGGEAVHPAQPQQNLAEIGQEIGQAVGAAESPTYQDDRSAAALNPEPVYGMSAPEAQAMMNNPGIMAQRRAAMRGGGQRPGTEIDVSQIGKTPLTNTQNPGLSFGTPPPNLQNAAVTPGAAPNLQRPGLGLG